jgi:hypothetical protein
VCRSPTSATPHIADSSLTSRSIGRRAVWKEFSACAPSPTELARAVSSSIRTALLPPGSQPAQFGQRYYQNRVIKGGDIVALLVEDSGPGGMYAELGRTCVVSKVSAELKDEFAFSLEARKFNLGPSNRSQRLR